MSNKLTDTQLMMLSAAAQRDDCCLVVPANLKGGAAQKIAARFVAGGLVKEIKAKAATPVWRRDEQAAQSYALKLTAAGVKAIAVEESPASQAAGAEARHTLIPANASTAPSHTSPDADDAAGQPIAAPRAGSKLALVIAILQKPEGATLADLASATHWLPHTARAALTGLRKRGFGVDRERTEGVGSSTYRIAAGLGLAG